MRRSIALLALALASSASLLVVPSDASLSRVLRQSTGETEQEATTAKSAGGERSQPQQADRLYPDLPRQASFAPANYPAIAHHHGQTPFVPFGVQIPTSRLNADQQPAPFGRVLQQPAVRPMTPAERLQSQSFASGLGKRLLSLVGIDDTKSNSTSEQNDSEPSNGQAQQQQQRPSALEETARALQNSTVLQQLNRGVNSIYGGLSKMYNSTVQEQLNLLQERLKIETQNSTNPWHQRMAEQVPQFFKQMAARVGQAQDQLNKVWQDVSQAAQGNGSVLSRSAQANNNAMTQFFSNPFGEMSSQGDFFQNVGRSLGFSSAAASQPPAPMALVQGPAGAAPMQQQQQQQRDLEQRDLGAQLMEFWHAQVQPQIGMVRNQVARVWRDLTTSGAFTPETFARARNLQGARAGNETAAASASLVDDILRDVDMSGSEYTLVDSPAKEETSNGQGGGAQEQPGGVKLSPQMQNRLIAMQRDLNQLWMGLTNSLQGAISNVRNTVNPPLQQLQPMASNVQQDSALNEIDGKVKDLSKLQRDADMVYETVQQQQRETQQRQTIGDRFKNFFNNVNVDLSNVNQLPDRIGQSFNRFGVVVNDLWNQLPERWDNFMQNMRPQQQQQQQRRQQEEIARARMKAAADSSTTTTTGQPEKPER